MRALLLAASVLALGCRRDELAKPDRAKSNQPAAPEAANLIVALDPRYLAKHNISHETVVAELRKAGVLVRRVSVQPGEIEIAGFVGPSVNVEGLPGIVLKESVTLGHVASLRSLK